MKSPKEKIQVTVTQQDIERGIPCSASRCAIARALKRTCKGQWLVVSASAFSRQAGKGDRDLRLPKAAVEFERNYDLGRVVHPFTFSATVCEKES